MHIENANMIAYTRDCLICTCALQYINSKVFRAHASASRKTSQVAVDVPMYPEKC